MKKTKVVIPDVPVLSRTLKALIYVIQENLKIKPLVGYSCYVSERLLIQARLLCNSQG